MMLMHFIGEGDLSIYLNELKKSKDNSGVPDYNKAQQAVNDSILKRTKSKSLPNNTPIKDYIEKFNKKLNEIQ